MTMAWKTSNVGVVKHRANASNNRRNVMGTLTPGSIDGSLSATTVVQAPSMLPSPHPRATYLQLTPRVTPPPPTRHQKCESRVTDSAGEVRMRSSGRRQAVGGAEFVDAGGSPLGGGFNVEIGAETADVDGHGAEDVLEVGLGQAPVAAVADVRASDGFGDGALDPRPG